MDEEIEAQSCTDKFVQQSHYSSYIHKDGGSFELNVMNFISSVNVGDLFSESEKSSFPGVKFSKEATCLAGKDLFFGIP